MLPDFLIIGAAKAGTTSLCRYLEQHPDIFISKPKEPHFFALEGKDVDYKGPGDEAGNRCRITDIAEYEKLFDNVRGETAGEGSTVYLYHPDAPARIFHYIPDVKIVAILRNPVEQSYSSFLHMLREGREPCSSFADALTQESARIEAGWAPLWHFTRQGFYFEQLSRYFRIFGKEQIRIYLYEDLQNNPAALLKDLFRFLGVDENISIDTTLKFNTSGQPKWRRLQLFLDRGGILKKAFKPILPSRFRQQLLSGVSKVNLRRDNLPPLDDTTRSMLKALFHNDIVQLQELIGRDLSRWLE